MSTFDPTSLCGLVDHPDRHIVAATLGPAMSERAPQLMGNYGADEDILLYKAFKDVNGGNYVQYPRQTIGDCVSHGYGHGHDLLQAVEIVLGNSDAQWKEAGTEALYGLGREAGNMLGNQDGCYGSAMSKAMTTMGLLSREMIGPYDGQRAKQWGRSGLPSDLKTKAAQYKLGAAPMVRGWDELVASFRALLPVPVCSNQGFTMSRDSEGFCSPQGSWPHCMVFVGVRFGSRPGACCMQSWGMEVPSGTLSLDQPPNSFWVDRATVDRMLSVQDSFALSKSAVFERRKAPAHWTYDRAA